jgi:hypothetical protein
MRSGSDSDKTAALRRSKRHKQNSSSQTAIPLSSQRLDSIRSANNNMIAYNTDAVTVSYFQDLTLELQRVVFGFLAQAPFEGSQLNHETYPRGSLTHVLPFVSKQFHGWSNANDYWKEALVRQVVNEPSLWKDGLLQMQQEFENNNNNNMETPDHLVEHVFQHSDFTSYKSLYQHLVAHYLRFTGPVFIMGGYLPLDEPYALHLFEPRYRILLADVMRDQPESAKSGGAIVGTPYLIHANRTPLVPTTPALLVQLLSCTMYPDGRADVLLVPVRHVWLEHVWVQPHSAHLYCARVMKMSAEMNDQMNLPPVLAIRNTTGPRH